MSIWQDNNFDELYKEDEPRVCKKCGIAIKTRVRSGKLSQKKLCTPCRKKTGNKQALDWYHAHR